MYLEIENDDNMYSFSKVTLENIIIKKVDDGFKMIVGQAEFDIKCPLEIQIEDICKAISKITNNYSEEDCMSINDFELEFVQYLSN